MHLCGITLGGNMTNSTPIKIFCVECDKKITPRLVYGNVVYPKSPKLAHKRFWQCVSCKNFVGCHENANKNKMRPLGVIANRELKQARIAIHNVIDPIWRNGKLTRSEIYASLGRELGYPYHTGELRSMEEARRVYKLVAEIHNSVIDDQNACVLALESA
jgi:hypothetical protein